ncbi:MAG TPA: SDR family NAD(P)-dependent oxidoreductase [Bacteroidales bacterium]|nr:SDR family NAD(P)-dependent oxidoreductase [Bacteroidales bacterium]
MTGASSGIGKACALEFASRSATVVLSSRNQAKLLDVEN